MLKYLITVTEGLALTAVLLGLLYAYVTGAYGAKGRKALTIGVCAGFAAAVVMAIMKNKTNLVHTNTWNMRIFVTSLIALVVFAAFSIKGPRKKGGLIAAAAASVLAFTLVFYAFPDVLAYPFTFTSNGISLLSTDYLYRFIGWTFGVILMIVTFAATMTVAKRAELSAAGAVLGVVLGINAVQQATKIIQVLYARRKIKGHLWFEIVRHASNFSDVFVYATLLAAIVIPVSLWIASMHVNEPYENPAQHRRIRANWRSARRWSATVIVCAALAVSNLTWVNAIANRPVELSPVEECELVGDNVCVPLERVEDGHLHRFAYTTPDGYNVRFIVIKKPNASSYGVGLDACDICGETGYYERDGQIVCKLCDVVMNINTIGFKGGCNPIVIDYSVEGGFIIVPTYTLIDHQTEFKK